MDQDKPPEYLVVSDMAEELAGLGSWRLDAATQAITWSRNMFRLHGLDPNIPPTIEAAMARVHPDDRGSSEARLAKFLSGQNSDIRTRFVHPDGTILYTEGRGACEFGPDGEVTAIIGVIMDVTARVEAEKAMAAKEAHLRLVADHGSDLIVEIDAAQVIRYVSPSVRRFGNTAENLIGRQARELLHPDDVPRIAAAAFAQMSGQPVPPDIDHTYRVLNAEGQPIWVEGNPTIVRDETGKPTGLITVLRDVTAQRAAREALEESERRYRLIADHSQDMIGVCDLDGAMTFVSPSSRNVLGYEPEEMLGKAGFGIVHPDDRQRIARTVRDHIAAGPDAPSPQMEYRAIHKDGRVIWLEARPRAVFDDEGRLVEVQDNTRDITARKATEAALVESETRYRLLADNATDIIACYDAGGRFTFLSSAIEAVMGYRPEDLVGRTPMEIMHPDDIGPVTEVFRDFARRAFAGPGAEPIRFSYRAFRKDGGVVWLEAHPKPIHDAGGRLVEFQDVVRDITDRKHLEEELREARDAAEAAAAVKSDFMANMSHEIRTPLTAVIGFSSLISARADLDPTAREHADRISSAGRALLALVNDVLDFSKLEAGRMELAPRPVDPATVAREALDLFSLQAESKGLQLVFEPAPALPDCVSLDPKAVGQVLLNLLGNAVKFSEAGQVALSLAYDPAAQALRVRIRDSGPGLTREQADRLFQRFSQVDASSTRRHGGTGLGLAICKGLVEAMGGEIGVDSVVGQGSVFHFTIPAPVVAPAKVGIEGAGDVRDLDGVRLLVIDDNPINRELVRALLTPLGIEVSEAVDGPNGLEVAAGLPFDVILLDIRMPGLSGPQVLARLRAEPGPNQDAPVLAFSADFEIDPAAGFDAVVTKPLDPTALIRAIAQWTDFDSTEEDRDVLAS